MKKNSRVNVIYRILGIKIHGLIKSQIRCLLGKYLVSKSFINPKIKKIVNSFDFDSIRVNITL